MWESCRSDGNNRPTVLNKTDYDWLWCTAPLSTTDYILYYHIINTPRFKK